MKWNFRSRTVLALTLLVGVLLGSVVAPRAQSPRKGGADVPVTPFEQWFKRLGLLNPNGGCDAALEYDSLNTAHVSDCTDASSLRDLKLRGVVLTGLPVSAQGSAGADSMLTKTVTGLTDAAATTVLTVTVPNAAHAAAIPVVLMSSLGAGGAVGAFECSGTAYGQIIITRTAGVATVATAVALSNAGSACVAGASTITTAYSVTAMTGATSATQTFNIQVTISHGTGSSTAHQVIVQADVVNANNSGITVS